MITVSCDVCVTRDVFPRCRISEAGSGQCRGARGFVEFVAPAASLSPRSLGCFLLAVNPSLCRLELHGPAVSITLSASGRHPGLENPVVHFVRGPGQPSSLGGGQLRGLGIDTCSAPKSPLYPTTRVPSTLR